MNRAGIGFSLIVSALAGCGTGQSSADTTKAAASTTPQTVGAQSGTDTNSLTSSGGVAGSSSTPKAATSAKRAATTTKVSGKSDARTQKPADRDSILGYDSVIRFPIKTLPTATSTPRK
jgi:hypothetical protein